VGQLGAEGEDGSAAVTEKFLDGLALVPRRGLGAEQDLVTVVGCGCVDRLDDLGLAGMSRDEGDAQVPGPGLAQAAGCLMRGVAQLAGGLQHALPGLFAGAGSVAQHDRD